MEAIPAHTRHMSPEKFSADYDLEFNGPGFYLTDTDTLLLVPMPPEYPASRENVWYHEQPEGTLYALLVYNCPFSQTIFGAQSLPPVRLDTRK